jgi:hypothetical protein
MVSYYIFVLRSIYNFMGVPYPTYPTLLSMYKESSEKAMEFDYGNA